MTRTWLNFWRAVGSVLALKAGAAPAAEPIDAGRLLDAIAAVESGNRPGAVGKLGERGRCQFMPATWARYTTAPFAQWAPVDCDLTRRVEKAHLAWLMAELRKRGTEPTPQLVAAAWRGGLERAFALVGTDPAQRVANLYWEAMAR